MIIAIAAILVIGLFILIHQWSKRTCDSIDKEKTLQVVTLPSHLNYYVENDSLKGLNFELVKSFADSMGYQLSVTVEKSYSKCVEGIENHTYDIFIDNIPITIETRRSMVMSRPIGKSRLVLMQLNEPNLTGRQVVRDAYDLDGDTIYIKKDSPYMICLKHLEEDQGIRLHIVSLSDDGNDDLGTMISYNKILFAACNNLDAEYSRKQLPNLDINTDLGCMQLYGWGLTNCAKLDSDINRFIESQSFQRLYNGLYSRYLNQFQF